MSEVKRYKITWNAHEDMPVLTVEINPAVCTLDTLFAINDFFTGADGRLAESDDDIVSAVLKMLAVECFMQNTLHGLNAYGMICQFKGGNVEGWPPMDGSCGIKIVGCDVPEVNFSDMDVEEVL